MEKVNSTLSRIAVVVTVLNEREHIKELISALKSQSLKPGEILIVDGGSTDGTWNNLQDSSGIKVFQQPGNRSLGRNFGVSKTSSPVIAFTDAGCVPQENWLAELVKPFRDKEVEVVSGYYKGRATNIFEKSLLPYVLVMPDQIKGEFYPSTRSMAMRKTAWTKSGGFNPKLDHNEDFEFAHRIKKMGVSFVFAPKAIVIWYPRKNLQEAAWMFLRFAIGDVHAGILRPKVKLLAIRYYLFFFLLFITQWTLVLVVPYLIWAVAKNYRYVKDFRAIFWLPVLQLTADIMVLFGTIIGLLSKV